MSRQGNAIVLAAGAAGLALAALCLAFAGAGQQGTAAGLRATALLATPFLISAYAAPALAVLWPGELSGWLLRHGREFGLAFSAVLAVHLILVFRLLSLPPNPPLTLLGLTPGFLTYVVLAGLTLSSIGWVAGTLGPERVRLLRRFGAHWVFAVFALALLRAVFLRHSMIYLAPLLAVMTTYALRLTVWRRASRRAHAM